jgi:hypothetical protein
MDNELLTLGAMARRLRVAQTWLKNEAEAGRIPCLRANSGRYLFASAAVEQVLLDRAAAGDS